MNNFEQINETFCDTSVEIGSRLSQSGKSVIEPNRIRLASENALDSQSDSLLGNNIIESDRIGIPSEGSSYLTSSIILNNNSREIHLQTFIARVLDWDDHSVKTEWLINKEKGVYQERYFPREVFKDKFLSNGFLLKVFLSAKKGELKLRFIDGSSFLVESPFPKVKIKRKDSPLFKFNK